ncbi:MAG: UvrB/UvrC motif-containing protein [Candidatus Eisenbacteria bacterium]|nr:UvrB/UvrC motif-containing protein [Candidatus Eisenbacteria bacterium]
MQCQICRKAPATDHIIKIVNNKIRQLHVCRKCAEEKKLNVTNHGSISELLSSLFDEMGVTEEEKIGRIQCPSCGLLFSSFRETGHLGCPECYSAFKAQIKPLLRRIHGSTRHSGKAPLSEGGVYLKRREMQKLHEELEIAIEKEEFEKAADIRDKIRTLESEGSTP